MSKCMEVIRRRKSFNIIPFRRRLFARRAIRRYGVDGWDVPVFTPRCFSFSIDYKIYSKPVYYNDLRQSISLPSISRLTTVRYQAKEMKLN